ncbi:C69 family dipeptidase [candidate division KSB1 bacterium]|nr:C69 family dipeptidase [candidate division KSB1 bacterium]
MKPGNSLNMRFISVIILLTAAIRTGYPCTSIMVGKNASTDGSVIASHTCDSYDDRTWVTVVPHRMHEPGAVCEIFDRNLKFTASAFELSKAKKLGEIPQVSQTWRYFNTAYPCMNEHQLAIGESTFGGRNELRSEKGLLDCYELVRLMLERATTAREAIKLLDELTAKYGYRDSGECLTIADKKEVWHLEILGSGKNCVGAVWAARRIPDDHIGVVANGSRIRQLDLDDSDMFTASKNVFSLAEEMRWWTPQSGKPFEFCYAYSPESRRSMASRRREWRVFSLLAPSRNFDPNAENFPFSIKPDSLVYARKIMAIFRDTYEGTDFDMTRQILVTDKEGKAVKSPYANPFMPYDMMPLFNINGGWGAKGERCIARWYCTYVTVTQSRDWLPDPIGGLVWLGYDNPAMTAYAPLYCGILDVPDSYKICGRPKFNRECAWWAFNRVADLAQQRWGDMRFDVDSVRIGIEKAAFANQNESENQALALYKSQPDSAAKFLTQAVNEFCNHIVDEYWKLGDHLWSKYTGKF